MSVGRDLSIEWFVIGGGNDQPATVQIRLKVTALDTLTAAATDQFPQLRFDVGCDHPQQRAGIGQQAGLAQSNLPPPTTSTRLPRRLWNSGK